MILEKEVETMKKRCSAITRRIDALEKEKTTLTHEQDLLISLIDHYKNTEYDAILENQKETAAMEALESKSHRNDWQLMGIQKKVKDIFDLFPTGDIKDAEVVGLLQIDENFKELSQAAASTYIKKERHSRGLI